MSPEVEASLIKVASDWAIILSNVGAVKTAETRKELLAKRFKEAYTIIRGTIEAQST